MSLKYAKTLCVFSNDDMPGAFSHRESIHQNLIKSDIKRNLII